MFSIIRLAIFFVFLGCPIVLIKRYKITSRKIICVVLTSVSIVLIVALAFFPFENIFITFGSPKEAYEYYSGGKSNVVLVVEGKNCDFVVDQKHDSDTYLIIPKTTAGWKIGVGLDTKKVVQKLSEGIVINVYRYKNTSDFFITVLDTNGGKSVVTDDYETQFHSLERENNALGKTFVTYYAYVSNLDPQYIVTVNGNDIVLP